MNSPISNNCGSSSPQMKDSDENSNILQYSDEVIQTIPPVMKFATLNRSFDKDVEVVVFSFVVHDLKHQIKKRLTLTSPIQTSSGNDFIESIHKRLGQLYQRSFTKHIIAMNREFGIDHTSQHDLSSLDDAQSMYENNISFAFYDLGSRRKFKFTDANNLEMLFASKSLYFRFNDVLYLVHVNLPSCSSIYLSPNIMSRCYVHPHRLNLNNASVESSTLEWYLSTSDHSQWLTNLTSDNKKLSNAQRSQIASEQQSAKWSLVHVGPSYLTRDSDVGHFIKVKCTPISVDEQPPRRGTSVEVASILPVSESPHHLAFERRHMLSQAVSKKGDARCIRVLSYNLLSDSYADSQYSRNVLHPQCPHHALHFDYRRQLLYRELVGFHSDVMCLQEVDRKFHNADLKSLCLNEGYESSIAYKNGNINEGVACLWDESKYEKVEYSKVALSSLVKQFLPIDQLHLTSDKMNVTAPHDMKHTHVRTCPSVQTLFNLPTVLLVVLLKARDPKATPQYLMVANTHLYFKPNADDIRLMQMAIAMGHISNLHKDYVQRHNPSTIGLIFGGDFNSTPPFGVYEFFRLGHISKLHSDWSSSTLQDTEKDDASKVAKVAGSMEGFDIRHPFEMDSACGTPKYTNYTLSFADCLDYIFYERNRWRVRSVVDFPTESELKAHQAIPNVIFPSDHIPLVADLEWSPTFKDGGIYRC